MRFQEDCSLCQLTQRGDITTHLYKETKSFVIVDSPATGNVLMLVWREHRQDLNAQQRAQCVTAIMNLADKKYGVQGYYIDFRQWENNNHFSLHARPY